MDADTRRHFEAHVNRLVRIGTERPNSKRGRDAIRSLACMALIANAGGPDGGGEEVPDNVVFLNARAA